MVRPAEEVGKGCDGFDQQRVQSGLLVGGALRAEAGVPLGLGLLLVLGGLSVSFVACPLSLVTSPR